MRRLEPWVDRVPVGCMFFTPRKHPTYGQHTHCARYAHGDVGPVTSVDSVEARASPKHAFPLRVPRLSEKAGAPTTITDVETSFRDRTLTSLSTPPLCDTAQDKGQLASAHSLTSSLAQQCPPCCALELREQLSARFKALLHSPGPHSRQHRMPPTQVRSCAP